MESATVVASTATTPHTAHSTTATRSTVPPPTENRAQSEEDFREDLDARDESKRQATDHEDHQAGDPSEERAFELPNVASGTHHERHSQC